MNKNLFAVISLLAGIAAVQAQDAFQNLDFESAQNNGNPYAATNALPAWSAFALVRFAGMTFTQQLSNISIGYPTYTNFAPVALATPPGGYARSNTIDGAFSVLLSNGFISQTGQVPVNAEALLFKANSDVFYGGPVQVSLGGQSLSFVALLTVPAGANLGYTLYGADISGFAGQTADLVFSGPGAGRVALLDNIEFSPTAVPEPSWISLTCIVGGLLFYLRARKRSG